MIRRRGIANGPAVVLPGAWIDAYQTTRAIRRLGHVRIGPKYFPQSEAYRSQWYRSIGDAVC